MISLSPGRHGLICLIDAALDPFLNAELLSNSS
jgi:hypothetical protein